MIDFTVNSTATLASLVNLSCLKKEGVIVCFYFLNEWIQDSAYFIDKEGICTRRLAGSKTHRQLLAHKKNSLNIWR
jgi:hypothetical protein